MIMIILLILHFGGIFAVTGADLYLAVSGAYRYFTDHLYMAEPFCPVHAGIKTAVSEYRGYKKEAVKDDYRTGSSRN